MSTENASPTVMHTNSSNISLSLEQGNVSIDLIAAPSGISHYTKDVSFVKSLSAGGTVIPVHAVPNQHLRRFLQATRRVLVPGSHSKSAQKVGLLLLALEFQLANADEGPVIAPLIVRMMNTDRIPVEFALVLSFVGAERGGGNGHSAYWKAKRERDYQVGPAVEPAILKQQIKRSTNKSGSGNCSRCGRVTNWKCATQGCTEHICNPNSTDRSDCLSEHRNSCHLAIGDPEYMATLVTLDSSKKNCSMCTTGKKKGKRCSICKASICGSCKDPNVACWHAHMKKKHPGRKYIKEPFRRSTVYGEIRKGRG